MAIHHVALATTDTDATHRFYTEAMGFRLAKVVAGETEHGWSKHIFYDTGDGGFIAFWELHDSSVIDYRTDISIGMGLPIWVNHLAFTAPTVDYLTEAKERWLSAGVTVMEVDHDWCRSIYTTDPNGVLVEWCAMVRDLNDDDRLEAESLLTDTNPPLAPRLVPVITKPAEAASALAGK